MFLMYFNILDLSLDRIAFVKKMGYIFLQKSFLQETDGREKVRRTAWILQAESYL